MKKTFYKVKPIVADLVDEFNVPSWLIFQIINNHPQIVADEYLTREERDILREAVKAYRFMEV